MHTQPVAMVATTSTSCSIVADIDRYYIYISKSGYNQYVQVQAE